MPGQYADWKSLVGDAADNIKGAEKVGAKTAAALLHEFGTLEQVLLDAEKIAKPSVRESILRNADRLWVNYQMIKLAGGAALPFSGQEMKYRYDGKTTNEVLKGIGLRR